MTELSILPKGALLIRNGIIEEAGPARRVENLAGARLAREIDATGRVVMPAFVDADVSLVVPAVFNEDRATEVRSDWKALRLMSRKRVVARAASMSGEFARYGCLAVGAHTGCAADLQNIGKVLRAHQEIQARPLRIRSIFSPHFPADSTRSPAQMLDALTSKWLPAVKGKKLASVVELTISTAESSLDTSMLRAAAIVAEGLGFAIRLRSSRRLEPVHLQLALAAGAVGIVAPVDTLHAFVGPLSSVGCVRVVPASEGFDDPDIAAPAMRGAINDGAAIAITSSYRSQDASSLNMQYVLHLAVHELGLTPEEAITATTWNPACSLRLSHVIGSLEPGKSADLLIMDVPDYRELPRRAGHRDVGLVMRAGQIILRETPLSMD
jgi:imidazolonepropionase